MSVPVLLASYTISRFLVQWGAIFLPLYGYQAIVTNLPGKKFVILYADNQRYQRFFAAVPAFSELPINFHVPALPVSCSILHQTPFAQCVRT